LCSALLILSGTLEQLLAIAAVIFVLNYISAYVAVFVLRWSAPQAERPFRAWGFPLGTAIVLAGSLAFLALSIQEDPRSAGRAALLMALSLPLHWWTQRRSR
jgi:APA family basic amino acid/polyamine antiporter